MSDSFSTIRNGHICIPVKKEYKFKVSGFVIDKSATGNTLFMEPTAVAKLYGELQELKINEENEERRILYTLTALLADKTEVIGQNNATIEKLDFLFAKAKLSLAYEGTEPFINTDRYIKLVNGRHPLMEKNISVPLQFEIGRGINGVVNARMTFDQESLKPLYQLVIGEAGESCAFYIARKLGMPEYMLKEARTAAYGKEIQAAYEQEETEDLEQGCRIAEKQEIQKEKNSHIRKQKKNHQKLLTEKFKRGDSIMLYPEDYDFSVIFDTVEVRKARHQMQRKYVEDMIIMKEEKTSLL